MSDKVLESAKKEGEYEAYMEGITNMLYEEAMVEYCEQLNLKNECFCGMHTGKESGNKQFCGMTEDDEIEVGNLFDIKYTIHVDKKGVCKIHSLRMNDGYCPLCEIEQTKRDEEMDIMESQCQEESYE